jgi:hypothetical protein
MSTQQLVPKVVLKAKKGNIPFLLAVLKAIYSGLNAHTTLFSSLPVALATFLSQVQALDAAQQNVKEKVPGAVAQRKILRDAAYGTAESYRAYLQSLCAASPEQAATLAQAAGMKLAASPVRAKSVLAAKQGLQSGEVVLSANATLLHKGKGDRFFNWQYSVDGKMFVSAPSTTKTKTTIGGLPALTMCSFRVSITDATGQQEWSQIVTFLVR